MEISMEEAQKRLTQEGELLPGVERLPEGEAFAVRFPKAGKAEEGE
jgi:hypothetical protein